MTGAPWGRPVKPVGNSLERRLWTHCRHQDCVPTSVAGFAGTASGSPPGCLPARGPLPDGPWYKALVGLSWTLRLRTLAWNALLFGFMLTLRALLAALEGRVMEIFLSKLSGGSQDAGNSASHCNGSIPTRLVGSVS